MYQTVINPDCCCHRPVPHRRTPCQKALLRKHVDERYAGASEPVQDPVSSKGQATIPKAVRERLHLRPGDRFKFLFHPDGVIILPKISTSRLKGMIPKPARPVSLEEIDVAIETGATERFRRKK